MQPTKLSVFRSENKKKDTKKMVWPKKEKNDSGSLPRRQLLIQQFLTKNKKQKNTKKCNPKPHFLYANIAKDLSAWQLYYGLSKKKINPKKAKVIQGRLVHGEGAGWEFFLYNVMILQWSLGIFSFWG